MRIECPICKNVIENAPPDFATRPFCSSRCKLVDLGNWLDGVYRISEPLTDTADADLETELNSAEKPGLDRSRDPNRN